MIVEQLKLLFEDNIQITLDYEDMSTILHFTFFIIPNYDCQ